MSMSRSKAWFARFATIARSAWVFGGAIRAAVGRRHANSANAGLPGLPFQSSAGIAVKQYALHCVRGSALWSRHSVPARRL